MNRKNKSQIKTRVILSLVFVSLGIIVLLSARFISYYPSIAEQYARDVFPVLTRPFVYLSNLIPISVTEVFVVTSILSSPFLIFLVIYNFIKSKNKKAYTAKGAMVLAAVFLYVMIVFTLSHGLNYSRYPMEKSLEFDSDSSNQSVEALAEVLEWIVYGLEDAIAELETSPEGTTLMLTDNIEMFWDASDAMDIVADNLNDVLRGNQVRSKPVALSSLWSYTQIAGMYNPFFLEANINIDIPEYRIPMVVTHEIAHVRGIAREGDANLAAFLACISSPRADFRYSGYLYAYSYIAADLYAADPEAYFSIISSLPDQVHVDLATSAEYWRQFEGRTSEISTQVNDSYLRANQQEEGVLSYSLVSGLIVSYYHMHEAGDVRD